MEMAEEKSMSELARELLDLVNAYYKKFLKDKLDKQDSQNAENQQLEENKGTMEQEMEDQETQEEQKGKLQEDKIEDSCETQQIDYPKEFFDHCVEKKKRKIRLEDRSGIWFQWEKREKLKSSTGDDLKFFKVKKKKRRGEEMEVTKPEERKEKRDWV